MNCYFGRKYDVPAYEWMEKIPTPVGEPCIWCEEPIGADDDGVQYIPGQVTHHECWLRQAIGGVNHILGHCTCRGGDLPPDRPGVSLREAARAAMALFCELHGDACVRVVDDA